jgi:hypothetical protein
MPSSRDLRALVEEWRATHHLCAILPSGRDNRCAFCQRTDAALRACAEAQERPSVNAKLRAALKEARKWTETCDCITSEYGPGEANRVRKFIDAALSSTPPPEAKVRTGARCPSCYVELSLLPSVGCQHYALHIPPPEATAAPAAPQHEKVWILTEHHGGGIRGAFRSQGDADAEIAAIRREHPDLTRTDFVVQVERVRPPATAAPAACAWPGCHQPALCSSGNFGGQLVCSDHFKITNGTPATAATAAETEPRDDNAHRAHRTIPLAVPRAPLSDAELRELAEQTALRVVQCDPLWGQFEGPLEDQIRVVEAAFRAVLARTGGGS